MTSISGIVTERLEADFASIVSGVEDEINTALADQPYSVTCEHCGETLEHSSTVDNDGDLLVTVKPCTCLLEEYKGEQE